MECFRICRACSRSRILRVRPYGTRVTPRDYDAAVAALNTLQSNFAAVEAIRKLGPEANKLALPEMVAWVKRIGYEPADFDRLNPIHIAGTKGKGSTSAFVSSILARYLPTRRSIQAERLPSSVGLYTSPHLRFVRERIQINNEPLSADRFAQCFWTIWDRLEATSPASDHVQPRSVQGKPVYFHYLTLMALHCYLEERVGTAVIECGIGGEYDTTNILVRPSVTCVTSLGIDHVSLLGDTLESIAWHKSGIFKPDVPALTAPQPARALDVLHKRAAEKKTELHVVEPHAALDGITLGLQGDFQKVNASLAIAASALHLQRLGYTGIPDPFDRQSSLPPEFVTGLTSARLGGRCETRRDAKLSGLTWYLDGGHTLESIEMAGRWFATSAGAGAAARTSAQPHDPPLRILLFNQQTRDAPSLARRLHDTLVAALHATRPFAHAIFSPNTTSASAGYKPDLVSLNTNADDLHSRRVQHELAASWHGLDPEARVHVVGSVEEAVGRARELAEAAGDRPVQVLATGSLHLVGALVEVLESEAEGKGEK